MGKVSEFEQILREKMVAREAKNRDHEQHGSPSKFLESPIFPDTFVSIKSSLSHHPGKVKTETLIHHYIKQVLSKDFSDEKFCEKKVTVENSGRVARPIDDERAVGPSVIFDNMSPEQQIALYSLIGLGAQLPDGGPIQVREIKAEYRRLAKKYHPDLNSDRKDHCESFLLLQESFKILSKALDKDLL